MNVWVVILLVTVSTGLVFYFLKAVLGVKSEKIFGPLLIISVIVVLLAGLGYYLLWEKSIYVVIKSDDHILQKREVKYRDDILQKESVFVFSAVTRGISVINYTQQVKDFLAKAEVALCRDYSSQSTGTGRYEKKAGIVTVCVSKKGLRWYF